MQQPRVPPVDLRAFHEALPDVRLEGIESAEQEGPDQVVEVGVHGVIGKPEALADLAGVPLLSMRGSQHPQESQRGLRRGRETPVGQVALSQEIQVVALPCRERPAVQDATVGKAARQPVALPLRPGGELGQGQGSEFDEGEPSGERLRHLRHQGRGDGTQQQKATLALAVPVDLPPEPGKDLGPFLRLVEHQQAVLGDDGIPLHVEPQAVRLLFEVEVALAERAGEGRLAGLARPAEGNRRIVTEAFDDQGRSCTLEHGCILEVYFYFARRGRRIDVWPFREWGVARIPRENKGDATGRPL